jgi:hypothetical protein
MSEIQDGVSMPAPTGLCSRLEIDTFDDFDWEEGLSLTPAEPILKVIITAQSVAAVDEDSFSVLLNPYTQNIKSPTIAYSIVGDNNSPTSSYTIIPTRSDTATVQAGGNPFTVDVKLTKSADADGDVAAVQALLNYDAEFVAPQTPLPADVSQNGEGQLIISKYDMSDGVGDGIVVASVPFAPIKAGDAVFSISGDDELELEVTLSGAKDALAAEPGDDLTVTIAESKRVSFGDYAGLPTGYKLLKYEVDAAPDTVWTYGEGGPAMHYAKIEGLHYLTYIVESTIDATNAESPVETGLAIVENDGNLNDNIKLQITDAQIASDLAKGHVNYTDDTDFSYLSVEARLKADVNNDGAITSDDADAIQYRLHYGVWEWEAPAA